MFVHRVSTRSNLNFENLRLRTWRKLGPDFYLALGRVVSRVLDWFAGSGMNRKPLGFRVARLMWKPKVSCPPPSLLETTPEVFSGLVLNWLPPGGLEVTALGATEGASLASSVFVGDSFRSKPLSAAVTGTESSFGGGSSSSQVFPVCFLAGLQPIKYSVSPLQRHRIWVFPRILLLWLLSLCSLHWGRFRFLNLILPLRLSLEQLFWERSYVLLSPR
jgi:hypothetical protein